MWLVFSPFTLVEGTTLQPADASAMPLTGLECALVDLSIAHVYLALTLSHVFGNCTVVLIKWLSLDGRQFFKAILDEGDVGSVDSALDAVSNLQLIPDFEFWLKPVASLDMHLGVSGVHELAILQLLFAHVSLALKQSGVQFVQLAYVKALGVSQEAGAAL